jgi:hypothetical protein
MKMQNKRISWIGAAFGGTAIILGGCAVEAPDVFSDLDSVQETADLDPAPEDVRATEQKAVIKISTLAQLRAMSPTGDYELSGNINASATSTTAFVPIGSSATPFSGSFDGKGYKISNLKIAGNRSYAGLFGYASSANIENVKLENVSLTNGSSYNYSGALAGYLYATNVSGVEISGTINGGNSTGGLAGFVAAGSYIAGVSASSLHVSGGNNVGGLVGYSTSSSVVNVSVSGGSVTGGTYVGGVIGRVNYGGLSFSSATNVNVSGTTNTGGLMGYSAFGGSYYSSVSGQVSGGASTGGAFGQFLDATSFYTSANNVTVTGTTDTGGLAGLALRAEITHSSVSGTIHGGANTGGIVGRMSGTQAKRAALLLSYVDDRAPSTMSTVQGGTPVGMAVGAAGSYVDLKQSYAIGHVSGATTKIGGFVGEINAPGMTAVDDEPRAVVREIFTKVEVLPTFDSSNSNVYAGGLVGKMLGGDVQNINIAGLVRGRHFVGGAIGHTTNTGTNVTRSILRSILTRGEVTNVATPNRSGALGGATGTFARCTGIYWDSTTDGGTAPPLDPDESPTCQEGKTSSQLKTPARTNLGLDYPNGNFTIFTYGMVITWAMHQSQGHYQCMIGSGTDGNFGFGFCDGLHGIEDPPVWVLNSNSEYNTLVNIPNPSRQPKT